MTDPTLHLRIRFDEISLAAVRWILADEERKRLRAEFREAFVRSMDHTGGVAEVAYSGTEDLYQSRREAANRAAGLRRKLRRLVITRPIPWVEVESLSTANPPR